MEMVNAVSTGGLMAQADWLGTKKGWRPLALFLHW